MKIGRTGLGYGGLTWMAALLSLAMLCGCGGGDGSSSSTPPPTLSADQATYESFAMVPNATYVCYWSLPSSGAPVNDNDYFATNFASLTASPLTNGTQNNTNSALTSIANTLSIPAAASNPTRYLINGHILVSSQPRCITNVSYQGTGVKADTLAVDGITTVTSQLRSNYSVVPLTGTVASAPSDLAHWFSNLYYNPSLLSPRQHGELVQRMRNIQRPSSVIPMKFTTTAAPLSPQAIPRYLLAQTPPLPRE